MKSTGMVRRVDELGRIVVPKEIRKKLNIEEKDPLEIYVERDSIILKKIENTCIFCGNDKNLIQYNNKSICEKCLKTLNSDQTKEENNFEI